MRGTMIDFCSSCGFLLPLESVGNPLCGPCERNRQHQTSGNRVCECVICGKSRRPSPSPPKYSDCFQEEPHTSPKDCKKSTNDSSAGSKNNNRRKKKNANNTLPKDNGRLFDEKGDEMSASNPLQNLSTESKSHSMEESDWSGDDRDKEVMDWSQIEIDNSWGGPPGINDDWGWNQPPPEDWDCRLPLPAAYEETDNSGWTEVVKKKSPRQDTLFGNHDFPVLEKGLKESSVLQSVRDDWESQQEEYKRCLDTRDTADIAQLVAGKRRKSKNRHYYIGGVDISFIKDNIDACACLSVVRMPDLELVYQCMEMIKMTQPYIPGFLAFREVPPLTDLFRRLEAEAPHYMPDVVMVDGNGILHPRGFGLASQLGVTLNIPTIGVAKTLMTAQGISDDSEHKKKKHTLLQAGEGFDLIADSGQILGKCVRVHDNAPNPVYVSVGHKISLKSAVWLVLECSKFRIPEPVRRADLDSREYIRKGLTEPSVYIK